MKIVFAGLLSFIFFGCAHIAAPETENFTVNLKQIASDSRLKKIKDDQYQITFDDASLIKVIRYSFTNDKDLQTYLMNRRMILHQDYQNNIAPYFGLVETEKACVSRVNLKGDIKPIPGGDYFTMEFPVNSERVVSDCAKNDVWGLMTYYFYNCKASSELFEIRYSRALGAQPFEIQSYCE